MLDSNIKNRQKKIDKINEDKIMKLTKNILIKIKISKIMIIIKFKITKIINSLKLK